MPQVIYATKWKILHWYDVCGKGNLKVGDPVAPTRFCKKALNNDSRNGSYGIKRVSINEREKRFMSNLAGKKILFCQSRESGVAFEKALLREGATVQFLPTYRIEKLDFHSGRAAVAAFKRFSDFDWMIFTAPVAVKAIPHFFRLAHLATTRLSDIKIGVVGKKTSQSLLEIVPDANIVIRSNNLQLLLNRISIIDYRKNVKVLYPTSDLAIKNFSVTVSGSIDLLRVPLFRTVINESYSPQMLDRFQSQKYEAIFFNSPSSFDYFLHLFHSDELLHETAIGTLCNQTRKHIQARGYQVSIFTLQPEVRAVIKAMVEHFIPGKLKQRLTLAVQVPLP